MGIVCYRFLDLVNLPNQLTGPDYLNFLQNTMCDLVDNISLDQRHQMWLQHDGIEIFK